MAPSWLTAQAVRTLSSSASWLVLTWPSTGSMEAEQSAVRRTDPLSKLLRVGNQGGFRPAGSPKNDSVKLAVLYTTGSQPDWPDALDPYTGTFTYYGENSPGRSTVNSGLTPNHRSAQQDRSAHAGRILA
jgi:hypothetical protein